MVADLEFSNVYTANYGLPDSIANTLTLESTIVGWTDGVVKRQGNFPGCNAPAVAPQIQFITNITGLSGEPDVQALNACFYNTWEPGSSLTALPTNGQVFLPKAYDGSVQLYESSGDESITDLGTLLKFR